MTSLINDLYCQDVIDIDGEEVVSPSVLQLSAEKLHRNGVYLMDHGKVCEPLPQCVHMNTMNQNLFSIDSTVHVSYLTV